MKILNIKYILVVLVILVFGILGYQYWLTPQGPEPSPIIPREPEIKKPEEDVKDEVADWETYRNDELGLEFQYPKEWASITFDSQVNNEVYIFNSSDENIEKVCYFKPGKMLAFVVRGRDYTSICPVWKEFFRYSYSENILKILYPNKEIKTVYTTRTPKGCFDIDFIRNVSWSPNGEYIAFVLEGYERSTPVLINLNSGLDIISKNYQEGYSEINFYDPYDQVYWSSSSKILAIITYPCDMEPCRAYEGAIFVSDYGKPEKLNKILSLNRLNFSIDDLYFVNDSKLFFSLINRVYDRIEGKTLEYLMKYEYDTKTKALKKIEEKQL